MSVVGDLAHASDWLINRRKLGTNIQDIIIKVANESQILRCHENQLIRGQFGWDGTLRKQPKASWESLAEVLENPAS